MIAEYQVPVVAGAEAASAGGLAGCALRRSYQWGLDVSGTLTGAGGVGGLLAVHRHGAGAGATATSTATMTGTFLPCYDGNGNVTELVNWTSTTVVSARYEYSPFGETVLLEGEAIAGENPFRFSTKYTDGETGLVYYGYRYYAPELGRWLGRDPIGERGGLTLFDMCYSDLVNRIDRLGAQPVLGPQTSPPPPCPPMPTADELGRDGSLDALAATENSADDPKKQVEYAGAICERTCKNLCKIRFKTHLRRGTRGFSAPPRCPNRWVHVGTFHSHPDNIGPGSKTDYGGNPHNPMFVGWRPTAGKPTASVAKLTGNPFRTPPPVGNYPFVPDDRSPEIIDGEEGGVAKAPSHLKCNEDS